MSPLSREPLNKGASPPCISPTPEGCSVRFVGQLGLDQSFPRDTLTVSLGARQIVLERRTGLFARRVAARAEIPVAGVPDGSGVAVLDALDGALKDPRWHGANARVTVSNSMVRFVTVPASSEVVGLGDELALARLRLQQVHGVAGKALDVRLSSPLAGGDQLAAALESGFLEGLRASLSGAKLRTAAIEPLLMHAFNRARQRLSGGDYWFACAEPGLLGLGRVRRGDWAGIAFSPFAGELGVAIERQIREAVLLSADQLPPGRVYLHSQDVGFSGLSAGAGVDCVNVSPAQRA